MKSILYQTLLATLSLATFTLASAVAQQHGPSNPSNSEASSPETKNPYGPYEFLIGEWNVASDGGEPAVAVQRLRWGPNHSYIWFAGSLVFDGQEQPHFEGILIWNGVHKNLDMLLSMDLRSGLVQEQGTVSVQPDGTVVRDITATYSAGARPLGSDPAGPAGTTVHFRQTFKALEPDKLLTSVMRESDHGWIATFPGSDHMVMTRRRSG